MNVQRFVDKAKKDRELAEELASHLAHEQDANIARGLDLEEARRRARVRFGNPRVLRERMWRYRSVAWLDDHWRDVQFGLRSLELAAKDLLDSRMAYVAVSRGAEDAQIFTNDRAKLPDALGHDVSHESAHMPAIKPEQSITSPQPEIVQVIEHGFGMGHNL